MEELKLVSIEQRTAYVRQADEILTTLLEMSSSKDVDIKTTYDLIQSLFQILAQIDETKTQRLIEVFSSGSNLELIGLSKEDDFLAIFWSLGRNTDEFVSIRISLTLGSYKYNYLVPKFLFMYPIDFVYLVYLVMLLKEFRILPSNSNKENLSIIWINTANHNFSNATKQYISLIIKRIFKHYLKDFSENSKDLIQFLVQCESVNLPVLNFAIYELTYKVNKPTAFYILTILKRMLFRGIGVVINDEIRNRLVSYLPIIEISLKTLLDDLELSNYNTNIFKYLNEFPEKLQSFIDDISKEEILTVLWQILIKRERVITKAKPQHKYKAVIRALFQILAYLTLPNFKKDKYSLLSILEKSFNLSDTFDKNKYYSYYNKSKIYYKWLNDSDPKISAVLSFIKTYQDMIFSNDS